VQPKIQGQTEVGKIPQKNPKNKLAHERKISLKYKVDDLETLYQVEVFSRVLNLRGEY
jgi:hypothetical protein